MVHTSSGVTYPAWTRTHSLVAAGFGALGAFALWASVRSDRVERACITAVTDICTEAGQGECDKDAECERYLARYCRARAVNECEGE